jgi:hypothetical protein
MTTTCTFFDPATGTITQVADLSDETFEYYVNDGATALVNLLGNAETQYVVDNALVDFTPEELAAKRAMAPGWLWQMPERIVVDMRELVDVQAASVLAVDHTADIARAAVVGDPVRVKEYERAQQQAEAFRDAGFTGTAPSCVACWATAKEWTDQQAAEDILAASARWLGALDGIRALRLQAKEDIRRATTNAEVDTLLATFTSTLTAAMQGVQ